MKKFLSSKCFVIVTPILTLVVGLISGWLLGYQPYTSGSVSGTEYGSFGIIDTTYIFKIKFAIGYWLLAILISFVVLLLCIIIKKQYTEHSQIDE